MKARETGQFSGRFFVSTGRLGRMAKLQLVARLELVAMLELTKPISQHFVMND